jgi:hypothetical protein
LKADILVTMPRTKSASAKGLGSPPPTPTSRHGFSLRLLRNPLLYDTFGSISAQTILPGRNVLFHLFSRYKIRELFPGISHLFDACADTLHYPFLIHLFYTNLQMNHETGVLSSLVRDVEIEFDSKLLGEILEIPPSDTLFNTIELNDERVFEQILLPEAPHCPPFKNTNLQTRARIAGRILAHNVLPKTGSFDYYSTDLSTALYVLFGNISVNWANVYFTNLWKQKPFLPYGCLLTRIFRHFKVPLTNEKYIEQKEFFDQTIFKRMKIKYLPPLNVDQTEPSDPNEPSISEPSPSATPSSHAKRKKFSTNQDHDEVMQRLEALELHQHTFREDVTQQLASIQKDVTAIKDLLNSLF